MAFPLQRQKAFAITKGFRQPPQVGLWADLKDETNKVTNPPDENSVRSPALAHLKSSTLSPRGPNLSEDSHSGWPKGRDALISGSTLESEINGKF